MSIELVLHNMVGYENATMHFESEIRAMNRICDSIHDGVIVSIGSFRGQMDAAIALHAHVPVFCIDPRQGWVGEPREFGDQDRPFWMQNIMSMGLSHKARPIELPSLTVAKIWDKPIGLLFVDGNHREIEADLAAWMPHVIPGGIIALHDANLADIIQAYTSRDDLVEIERADLTAVFKKEPLYEEFTYDGLTMFVRKGPYNKDDKYVWGEVRSYSLPEGTLATILDIGGHIGAFSCWQASLHPEADIVAVEPETSGYRVLAKNAAAYPNITVMNARVGYDDNPTVLFVDPVNSGSHQIIPQEVAFPGQSVVPAPERLTMGQIIRSRGWTQIDLLKVDAEGAEDDILLNCPADTLRRIKHIAGEFHFGYDHFMKTVGARLQLHGFSVVGTPDDGVSHSTFVAVNEHFVEPEAEPDIEYGLTIDEEVVAEYPADDYRKPPKITVRRKTPAAKPKGKGAKKR